MIEFPKRILLFGMQQEKKKSIMRLCREMHIPVTQVPSGRYLQPLGVLAGVPMMQEKQIFYEGEALPQEMMVLCGLSGDELDTFLDTYRQSRIAPVAYKAVLTVVNMSWTPPVLFAELQKEHAQMSDR